MDALVEIKKVFVKNFYSFLRNIFLVILDSADLFLQEQHFT